MSNSKLYDEDGIDGPFKKGMDRTPGQEITHGPVSDMVMSTGARVSVGSFKVEHDDAGRTEETYATLAIIFPDGSAAECSLRLCDVEELAEEMRSIFDEVEP